MTVECALTGGVLMERDRHGPGVTASLDAGV